jgi:ubiquinone/menaquinone biosynthesis C-methylase UbiE
VTEPRRNDPAEWTGVAAAYEEVQEPFMGKWADDAIRLANVTSTDRVLDVATGPGTLGVRAAKIARSVVATDYADGMLDRVRARVEREGLRNMDVRKMNGQLLELASDSFDAAFSLFGLIFFPDRGRGFAELHRVLVPGGRAVVVGWGPVERIPLFAAMLRGVREALPDLPPPQGPIPAFSLADPTRFATEMVEAGFDEVEITASVKEFPIEGTIEEFFDRQAPSNVLFATLKPKLSPEAWGKLKEICCRRMKEVADSGNVALTVEANFGIGWKSAGDGQ